MRAASFHAFLLVTLLGLATGCASERPRTDASGDSAEARGALGDSQAQSPGADEPAGPASVRDSAGIAIVEYEGALADLPIAFRISETPILDLGGSRQNPDQEIDTSGPWHDAVALSDGRWVVTDNSDYKVYSPTGAYLSTIGRRGSGPGEFRQARAACITTGDTILAIHYSRPRVSVFDGSGALVRDFTVEKSYIAPPCFADGSFLAVGSSRPDPADPVFHVAELTRVSPGGTELGTFGPVPHGFVNSYVQSLQNVVPHGEHVFVGDGRSPEVRVYALDGSLDRIIRWTGGQLPLTEERYTELARATIPTNTPSDQVQRRMADALARPRPTNLPAYGRIDVDAADRIWVEDYALNEFPPVFPMPWTVFDPSGQPLGRVVLPTIPGVAKLCPQCPDARVQQSLRLELRSIGRDRVVLEWRDDELGFVHLSFHALESLK